jgi:hypothetical protein
MASIASLRMTQERWIMRGARAGLPFRWIHLMTYKICYVK